MTSPLASALQIRGSKHRRQPGIDHPVPGLTIFCYIEAKSTAGGGWGMRRTFVLFGGGLVVGAAAMFFAGGRDDDSTDPEGSLRTDALRR